MEAESHLDFYRRWHRLSKPYIRWQFEQFRPYLGRRVADIGCGLGNFTGMLRDRDFYLGIDQDEELLRELEREYRNDPKVKTARLDITKPELEETLRVNAIDTILCVNVLEHVVDDSGAVRNMANALPSGGHLCLLMPALPVLFGTLDELDGHLRRYTKRSVRTLFHGLRGRLLRLYYFNFLGIAGWFLKARVLRQKRQTNDNYVVMNALLPLVRPLERLLPPPAGMSIVAIFRNG